MTIIRLANERAVAEVALVGAELRSWVVDGVSLLWEPDTEVWADTAPLLFPVVGWSRGGRIVVDGVAYPMEVHGFARRLAFEVLERGPGHVRLGAGPSLDTEKSYPFDWVVEVTHSLDGLRLDTRLAVTNRGRSPMPYACGLHPGFRWPFAGGAPDDYTIVFEEREASNVPVISPDGLFTRQSRRVPMDGRRLQLSDTLMGNEALCFLDAASTSLRFAHRSGAAIEAVFHDLPHIALWSRPAGRFLSIEGWTGHGDLVDADGDLARRPSMRVLPPGSRACHGAAFSYAAPHRIHSV